MGFSNANNEKLLGAQWSKNSSRPHPLSVGIFVKNPTVSGEKQLINEFLNFRNFPYSFAFCRARDDGKKIFFHGQFRL